jgi:WD40 repeat protein/DNA-binding SARP family transcriptional activator
MAGRLEFRILGPLAVRVDGVPVPIGGPKQRALLALLLLSANRVVSRDRLVGELFADQSLNSADHALRNHVSRLRKALATAAADEPRLVARTPGYLLRVEPGELDLEHFERLAATGREALAAGDPAVAAEALRAAERLWDGRPLADLELEPFARVEVERLEELRLAAVEERIDAELGLGRQPTLVAELEGLSADYPYRERFHAQLMLALYRSGRQAEGLEVFRRTRALLRDELGLEPGIELQELERAILVQDPALHRVSEAAGKRPAPLEDVCPFKGLAPFETADAQLFFGRERLVDELVGRLSDTQLLAIVGPSGSGKSSLLQAGLVPALGRDAIVVRPGERPAVELAAAFEQVSLGGPLVLAVDQFEELFAGPFPEPERRALVDALVEAAWDPEGRAVVLLALRADFFGRLASYPELADLVGPNHVLLGPMSTGELRRAIEGPAEQTGLSVEPALVDALVDDVAGEPGGLPLLSTALLDLWRVREGTSLTLAAYERTGGVRGAVGRHAEAAFRSLTEEEQRLARRMLLRLVDGGGGEPVTRRRATRAELEADDEAVARVLATLVERRLLVTGGETVELVHEALLERWPRLVAWVDEDVQGRQLHRHLNQAAIDWDAAGRDAGELYRGARLAAALDWVDATGGEAGLNRLEAAFLAESRVAAARANRRLRAYLALAVLLLLAALLAGLLALRARGAATRQATAAIAQRLGAQALAEPQLDRSLLLAREGANLDDSEATRSNLLAALLRSPAAVATLRPAGAGVLDDALTRDGRTLAVRGNDGDVSLFDTATLRERGGRLEGSGQIYYFGAVVRPKRALAFSPDARTLAVGDSDGNHATLSLVDARTRRTRAFVTSRENAVTADVIFAPDGRTVLSGEGVSGAGGPPAEVLVLRNALDGTELRRSKPIAAARLIGFTRDGRGVLVTTGEKTSFLLETRTFRRVRTFSVSGAAALSHATDEAAFGQDDGSVTVVDLRTGAQRPMGRRATGRVIAVAFSHDGSVLATGSDDGSVAVWDVSAGTLRETFGGHAAAAFGLLFSPDGSTLYSGSTDGSEIAWDVHGERRLGRPFRFAPHPAPGIGPHAPPAPGAATAVAVSPDGSLFVTSPGPDRVTLWRADDQSVVASLRGPCGNLDSLAFSHDGRLIAATGDADRTVVWNVRTRTIERLLGPQGPMGASGVNVSYDDRMVATAGVDGYLRVYDLATGRSVVRQKTAGTLQDVDFSSDGKWIAAAGLPGDIVIWNLRRGVLERTIHHTTGILSIRFSGDGRQIATGDFAGNVEFWDPATGRQVGRTLGGQNGIVLSVTFDPTGTEVMTTSRDGKFRLWNLASGKLVGAPLPGDDTGGWGTFFPDGRRVIAVFDSGIGVVWNVDPSAWKAQACTIAHRNLTRAEWRDLLPQRRYRPVCS